MGRLDTGGGSGSEVWIQVRVLVGRLDTGGSSGGKVGYR